MGREFNRQRLQEHLVNLGMVTQVTPFEQLALCYGNPARAYHNAQHIESCLQLLEQHQAIAHHPHEVAIALWFHDAIYDSRRQDNEQASAIWAREFLGGQGVTAPVIERITALILATQTHIPKTTDAQLMVDIDLAILGSDRPTYDAYAQGIRQEYQWVSATQYQIGRARILNTFLARPTIFHTAPFRQRYEVQARENLHWELRNLES